MRSVLYFFAIALFLVGCAGTQSIVNNVEERDANDIVVFLASKGIASQKVAAAAGIGGGASATSLFNISVDAEYATNAMALLSRQGLPRRQGTNLLTLFAKSGLMSSDREETIRYQAGLAEQLANTCTSCHTLKNPPKKIGSLQGKSKASIISAMQKFKTNQRTSTVMNQISKGYDDSEIEQIATYFSSVTTPKK